MTKTELDEIRKRQECWQDDPEDVPALLSEIDSLLGLVERMQGVLEDWKVSHPVMAQAEAKLKELR